MAKKKSYGVVNVVANPHPPATYEKVFDEAAKLTGGVNFRGDNYARISKLGDDKRGVRLGRIAFWTEIDAHEPVLEKSTLDQVMIEDTPLQLSSDFGFNSKVFYFAFRESDHTLFVELSNDLGHRVSVSSVVKALDAIFQKTTVDGVDAIRAHIKSKDDAVEYVLAIPKMRKIEIEVNLPNPDDLHSEVEKVFAEMRAMNTRQNTTVLVRDREAETIKLDERHKTLAEVAKDNGEVKSFGRDGGRVLERSTKQHPLFVELQQEKDEDSYTTVQRAAQSAADG